MVVEQVQDKVAVAELNGGLAILTPSPRELAAGKTIEEIATKDFPAGTQFKVVNKSDLPNVFRGAWKLQGNKVEIDLDKAKDVRLQELRLERNEALKELDLPFTVALEQADAGRVRKLGLKKQILRDLPEKIAAELQGVTEIAGLQTYKPEELKK